VRLPARERRKAGSSHWRSGKRGTEQSRRRATRRQRRLHPLAGPMREAIAEVADLLPGKVVIDPSNPVSVGVDGPVGWPAPHVTSLIAASIHCHRSTRGPDQVRSATRCRVLGNRGTGERPPCDGKGTIGPRSPDWKGLPPPFGRSVALGARGPGAVSCWAREPARPKHAIHLEPCPPTAEVLTTQTLRELRAATASIR